MSMWIQLFYGIIFILAMWATGYNLEKKKYSLMFITFSFGIVWLIMFTFSVLDLDITVYNQMSPEMFKE